MRPVATSIILFYLYILCSKKTVSGGKGPEQFIPILFALTIAGWIILNQTLSISKILGCITIFLGVIIVQFVPIYIKKTRT